jgi:hypothetical protein
MQQGRKLYATYRLSSGGDGVTICALKFGPVFADELEAHAWLDDQDSHDWDVEPVVMFEQASA